ncbi:hypothetical protein, partial [Frankia casuarinae]
MRQSSDYTAGLVKALATMNDARLSA